jgi:hypothetical protein
LLPGDCGKQLWADAGAGFLTGFAMGLTDGASLIAGGGLMDAAAVSGARGLFSFRVEATRQLMNNGGSHVNWWRVGAAGLGSGAGEWMGSQVGAANALAGQGRSLMQEQAAGGWFGGLVGAFGGDLLDAAEKEGY